MNVSVTLRRCSSCMQHTPPRDACTVYNVTMGGRGGVEYWGTSKCYLNGIAVVGRGGVLWFVGSWQERTRGRYSRMERLQTTGCIVHLISLGFVDFVQPLSKWLHASACISFSTSQPQVLEGHEYAGCPSRSVRLFEAFRKPQSVCIQHRSQLWKIKKGGGGHAAGRLFAECISAGGHRPEMWQVAVCYLWYCDRCLSTVRGELGEKQNTIKQNKNWSRGWKKMWASMSSRSAWLSVSSAVCSSQID